MLIKRFYFTLIIMSLLSSCQRSGKAIYKSEFGNIPESVEILHSQDIEVPVMDFSVWVHFKAPLEELQRIIKGYEKADFLGFPPSGIIGVPEDWISEEDFNSCTHYKRQNDSSVSKLYINCKNGEAIYVNSK